MRRRLAGDFNQSGKSIIPRYIIRILLDVGDSILAFRHKNFESDAFPVLTSLGDSNSGNTEDFASQVKAKAGMFPKPSFKQVLLLVSGDPDTIVFANDDHPAVGFMAQETDG